MVKYELYINGVQCDLAEDSDISLIYESPLFTELDAIQSNRSITIELPITRRNRRAIGNAMRTDVLAEEPYIKLPAALYIDGVDVFRRGFAVIDEIADVISCTLIFGNVENFEALDAELRSIEMEGNESLPWDSTVAWGDKTEAGDVEYIRADFGAGVVNSWGVTTGQAVSMQYARPSVQVPAVISGIEKTCNVKVQFNPDYFDITNLYLPLTGTEADENTPAVTTVDVRGYFFVEQNGIARYQQGAVDAAGVIRSDGVWDWVDISKVNTFGFKYRIQIPDWVERYGQPYLRLYASDTKDITSGSILLYEKTGTKGEYIEDSVTLETSGKRALIIRVYGGEIMDSYSNQVNGTFSIFGEFPNKKISYHIAIPTAPNLPDQTCAEFLQNLMNMFGLFAQAEGESTVRLIHPSELYDNIAEGLIVDWSSKLVTNERKSLAEPDSTRFYIDNWAQVTTIDYDNDDEVQEAIDAGDMETAGEITIENKNIDKEGDVSIDFSATTMKNQHIYGGSDDTLADVAVVPIWEAQEPDADGNVEYKYSDVSPRILLYEYNAEDPDLSRLTFPEELYFGGSTGLVSRYYGDLQKILNRARVITVRMRLTPLDLRGLDWGKPIYLRQFGQHFALYRITTDKSGISEVELIKL